MGLNHPSSSFLQFAYESIRKLICNRLPRKLLTFTLLFNLLLLSTPEFGNQLSGLTYSSVRFVTKSARIASALIKSLYGSAPVRQRPDTLADRIARVARIQVSPRRFVAFRDGKEGWAGGTVLEPPPSKYADKVLREDSYAVIVHTLNGGKSWSQQFIPLTRTIFGFYFQDERHGWALSDAELFSLDSNSKIWRRFKFSKAECPEGTPLKSIHGNDYYEPTAIYFLNSQQGWLAFKNGYLAKTTDGGRSWCDLLDPRSVWPDPGFDTYFQKIYFIDSMTGWALGFDSLYETKDGGATWKRDPVNAGFRDMYFLDEHHGWAVARDGVYRIYP